MMTGCRSQMEVKKDLPTVSQTVPISSSQTPSSQSSSSGDSKPNTSQDQKQIQSAGQENLSSEAACAHDCVEAWKVAVQQKNEAKAMEMLEKVDKENPNISTVQLMMGQVKDYFKKPKEALAYYRKAHAVNKFSSMQTLRLADSLRRNGEYKEAGMHYDRLIKNLEAAVGEYGHDDMAIVLASVRAGNAACLNAQGRKEEALVMVRKALTGDPENKEAKELLKKLGG